MSLSAERTAIAERAIRQTFERASVAWQAIPHWVVHDPGRVCIRNEVIFRLANPATQQSKQPSESPFGIDSLEPEAEYVKFEVTMAQAIALTPDALLTSVIPRTVALAEQVDKSVFKVLRGPAMLTAQSATETTATETTATKTTSSGTTSDWYRPLYVPSPAIRGMPA